MNLSHLSRTILRFLREETFSTVSVLQLLCKHNSPQATHQLCRRMIRDGLLDEGSITLIAGRPLKLFGITNKGLAYAFDLDEVVTTRKTFQISKVPTSILQHEIQMQIAHVLAIQNGWRDWRNYKHLGSRALGQKYPDALVTSPQSITCSIEIEQEIKSASRIRAILTSHLLAMKANQWQHTIYICPELDLAKRLERKFRSLDYVNYANQRILLKDAHFNKITFTDSTIFTQTQTI